ncbi:MAG: thioesterase family protein [bacterium]|nr:thioesterase family protein [bacterium]
MTRKLACRLKVRSYELDGYGHVNNAVFFNYYEQARVEYLEQRGLSFGSLWSEGYIFVIARAEIDYIEPLTISDKIEIVGEVTEKGNSSITIQQKIYRLPDRSLVSRGKFIAVFLDRKTMQPANVPESFQKEFL